jgi:hypothetical protein
LLKESFEGEDASRAVHLGAKLSGFRVGGTVPTLMPLSLQQDTTTLLTEMAMRPLLLSWLSMELPSVSRML